MTRKLITTLLMAAFLIPGLQAQDTGLSNKFVTSVATDGDGNIWVGTDEGLNCFDGIGVSSYYKHTSGLGGNQINYVFADRKRPVIWIAARHAGLSMLDRRNGEFTVFTNSPEDSSSLVNNDVNYVDQDQDGNIWVSSFAKGIDRLDFESGKFTHYNAGTLKGFRDKPIFVFKVRDDKLYLGHWDQGLTILSLKDGTSRSFRHSDTDPRSLPSDEVRELTFDNNGRLWVGTSSGLALFSESSGNFINFKHDENNPASIPRGTVYSVKMHGNERLLVATDLGGVCEMDIKDAYFSQGGERFTPVSIPGQPANLPVRSIGLDSYGNLWIGSYGRGLLFKSGRNDGVGSLRYPYALSGATASSLATGSNGELLAGTLDGRIDRIRNGQLVGQVPGIVLPGAVRAILTDSDGTIWAGGAGNSILALRKDGSIRKVDAGLPEINARVFLEDGNIIWAGTDQGLLKISRNSGRVIRHYTRDDGFEDDLVRALAKDARGRLWVGTYGRGVFVFGSDMTLLLSYNSAGGLPSMSVNHLLAASDGSVWMATREGLARFNTSPDHLTYVYTRKDGLVNDGIAALAEDPRGNIWFSTNKGVSCLTTGRRIINYDSRDDLPDGNGIAACTASSPNGIVRFGNTGGIGEIDTSQILEQTQMPPVVFRSGEDDVTVGYKDNYLSVRFCVPDYSYSGNVDYFYRFEDLSQEWRECGNELSFDHLPYGHHTLQVRAGQRGLEMDEAISSIHINVKPPIWLSLVAKLIYILLAIAFIFLAIWLASRYNRRENLKRFQQESLLRNQEINEERLKFYTNITHELRTPLTLILGPLDDLKNDRSIPPSVKNKVSGIHKNAERLLTLINQLLDFRKTETENKRLTVSRGNFSAFVEEQGRHFSTISRNADTTFTMDIEPGIEMFFDADAMTSIIGNLLSNAQKYTPEGMIRLSLHREGDFKAVVTVSDTGYGMSEDQLDKIFERYYQINGPHQASGTGIGLALVKNLCALHHIAISVQSELGKGSAFSLTVDTRADYPEAVHVEAETLPEEDEVFEPEAEENGTPRILVVEDNLEICEYISKSLSDCYSVKCVQNGREGLHTALRDIPDLVISDIMMPVMDGIELCKALKNDVRTSHIPIILLTAKSSDDSRREGYDVGADSYLVKPFNKELITSRITNILNTRKKLAGRVSKGEATEELSSIDNEFLQNFTSIVEENLSSEKLDLASLASRLCMSQSTMYRKVKGVAGVSPVEFVRNIRLNKAAELLKTTSLTISEISWRVGMGSPVYLRDCFKERFGITPSAYRNSKV